MGDEAEESNQAYLTAECLEILRKSSRGVKLCNKHSQKEIASGDVVPTNPTLEQNQFTVGIARLPRKLP
jgi:hypothetical protein